MAGGYLFGFLGVLLALPAASVIMVLLRYLLERYRLSELYNEEGPEDPVVAEVEVSVHKGGDVDVHGAGTGAPATPAAPPTSDQNAS
jgi:hypothetical protein